MNLLRLLPPRRLEPFFQVTPLMAEFWNAMSNLPLVMFGASRLASEDMPSPLPTFYTLMVLAGVCSFIHHATTPKWTIVIDWLPIASSILLGLYHEIVYCVSLTTCLKCLLAFASLIVDHHFVLMGVPWGHAVWHILAAYSLDSVYQDVALVRGGFHE